MTTIGAGNPKPSDYESSFGIDTTINNRALRSLRLLAKPEKLSRYDFFRMKFDQRYAEDAPIVKELLEPIFNDFKPVTTFEREALAILKSWDRSTDHRSYGAALAVLSWHPIKSGSFKKKRKIAPSQSFREAVHYLSSEFGRVKVELGEVQRLRRGNLDLPLGGGHDIISATDSRWQDERLVGFKGDSYINITEFSETSVRSFSRHQYGNSNRPKSKHYNDQAKAFLAQELKEIFRDKDKLLERSHLRYHPGQGTYNQP